MRTLLSAFTLALFSAITFSFYTSAHADTLANETEIRQLTDRIMTAAGKTQTDDAYAIMAPYVLTNPDEFERARLQDRESRIRLEQDVGSSTGFEFIRTEKLGESVIRLLYIEKAERRALAWQFIFFKTPAGWALSALRSSNDINVLFSCN
jgi:hypothetical protein